MATFPSAWMETALVTICPKGGYPRQFNAITETIDISEPDYAGESVPSLAGGRVWKQSPQEDGEVTLELYSTNLDEADNQGMFQFFGGIGAKTTTINTIDGDTTTISVDATGHGLTANDTVRIAGTVGYNGTYIVATVPTTDTLTIADTSHNLSSEIVGQLQGYYQNSPMITKTSFVAGTSRARDNFLVAIMWTDDTSATSAMGATSGTDFTALRFYARDCTIVSHKADFTDGILKITATLKFPAMSKTGVLRNYAWQSTNDTDTTPLVALTYT
jgi:hypothetical protein